MRSTLGRMSKERLEKLRQMLEEVNEGVKQISSESVKVKEFTKEE